MELDKRIHHHHDLVMASRNTKPEPSRLLALTAFEAVMTKGQTLDDWLEQSDDYQKLEPRDRRFCRRLVTTALRHHGGAMWVLRQYVPRPPKGRQQVASLILQLALTELIWLDGPSHAVVDQAVRLIRARDHRHLHGLINASLRRCADDIQKGKGFKTSGKAGATANCPEWLKTLLVADWGQTQTDAIMNMLMVPPPLDLSVVNEQQNWASRLGGVALPQGSIRLNEGAPQTLEGYDDGQWWVQDAAAAMPARLMGDVKGKQIIDACAAPGGKTAQLIAGGAKVTALDLSEKRLERLQSNLSRLGMTADVIAADVLDWSPQALVDGVLIDAPCSATGTIRRRPDILTRKTSPHIKALTDLQFNMIHHAASWLKPGGVLVFATCSLLRAEGEDLIAAIRAETGLAPYSIDSSEYAGLAAFADQPDHALRLMPNALTMPKEDGMTQGNDGFFMARFKRV
jgi:16S rRNA (cytosine967-C5)-methyltransferase